MEPDAAGQSIGKLKRMPKDKRGDLPGFVRFLRRYMSAWPILIAGLIGPMTKYFALIPVYKDQQNLLAFLTSMYGFLLAAALFYYRPVIAARPNQGENIVDAPSNQWEDGFRDDPGKCRSLELRTLLACLGSSGN